MADIEKILENLNLPKQLLDKSEALIKTLFGPSFDEIGGMISDSVKLRRFKNQLKIFGKAQEILKEKNIDPKKVSLKVLAPLIDYSSLEEEEELQVKWSKLTAHILSVTSDTVFHQNCISILNKLSSEEAVLLDQLHDKLNQKRTSKFQTQEAYSQQTISRELIPLKPPSPGGYPLDHFTYSISAISKEMNLPKNTIQFSVSNLVALGLLKWETDVEVDAEKASEDPEDRNIEVNVDVYNNDDFIFTPLGDRFVEVCEKG